MLYTACFSNLAMDRGNIPNDYEWGDVLMVSTMNLESQFRGYGIGLLALNRLAQHVARVSPGWAKRGLLVLEPSGMADYTARTDDHGEIQDKLILYYPFFGRWPLMAETEEHCAFVGHAMCNRRPEIRTVVPHLLQ